MLYHTATYQNISPCDLKEKLAKDEEMILVDVRTPAEHAAQAIEGATLLPVQELSSWVDELPKDVEIVVYCRVGNRSAFAAEYLARRGYTVKNLEGGIAAWNKADRCAYATA